MRPSLSPFEYGAYGTSFSDDPTLLGGPHAPFSASGRAAMSDDNWNCAMVCVCGLMSRYREKKNSLVGDGDDGFCGFSVPWRGTTASQPPQSQKVATPATPHLRTRRARCRRRKGCPEHPPGNRGGLCISRGRRCRACQDGGRLLSVRRGEFRNRTTPHRTSICTPARPAPTPTPPIQTPIHTPRPQW